VVYAMQVHSIASCAFFCTRGTAADDGDVPPKPKTPTSIESIVHFKQTYCIQNTQFIQLAALISELNPPFFGCVQRKKLPFSIIIAKASQGAIIQPIVH
jgi:hypothetical protein